MIEPGRYDITIHQGATFELNLQLKDSAGSPLVMSGYTVAGKVFDRAASIAIILDREDDTSSTTFTVDNIHQTVA